MTRRMHAAMLPDGRRLHLQDGPIDLVIEAFGSPAAVQAAYAAAVRRFDGLLDELCAELALLRAPARPGGTTLEGVVARRMYDAVAAHAGTTGASLQSKPPAVPPPGVIPGLVPGIQATGPEQRRVRSGRGMDPRHKAWDAPEKFERRGDEARSGALASGAPTRSARRPSSGAARHLLPRAGEGEGLETLAFITPMAAVAGAVADEVLAAMLGSTVMAGASLTRAYVNNGGDIALFLAPGESFAIGMVDRPDRPSLDASAVFGRMTLSAEDRIGGIATSGWRGRSFSLGIADAVTVLAKDAAAADAAATVVANAVDLAGHPAIVRVPATDVAPDSDLGRRLVTRGVGALTVGEIDAALAAGAAVAEGLVRRGLIAGAALHLAGETRVIGGIMALADASAA